MTPAANSIFEESRVVSVDVVFMRANCGSTRNRLLAYRMCPLGEARDFRAGIPPAQVHTIYTIATTLCCLLFLVMMMVMMMRMMSHDAC